MTSEESEMIANVLLEEWRSYKGHPQSTLPCWVGQPRSRRNITMQRGHCATCTLALPGSSACHDIVGYQTSDPSVATDPFRFL
ncbi:hypothetical protein M514_10966, partial [Trichuris suis]